MTTSNAPPRYDASSPPGTYDHIARECMHCEAVLPFYRAYKSTDPFRCSQCGQPERGDFDSGPPPGWREHASNGHADAAHRAARERLAESERTTDALRALAGNGGAQAALDALEPERAAAERTTVELQRDLAVQTAECARLQAELAAVTAERDGYYRLLVGLRDDVANLAHDIMTALAKTGETKT